MDVVAAPDAVFRINNHNLVSDLSETDPTRLSGMVESYHKLSFNKKKIP